VPGNRLVFLNCLFTETFRRLTDRQPTEHAKAPLSERLRLVCDDTGCDRHSGIARFADDVAALEAELAEEKAAHDMTRDAVRSAVATENAARAEVEQLRARLAEEQRKAGRWYMRAMDLAKEIGERLPTSTGTAAPSDDTLTKLRAVFATPHDDADPEEPTCGVCGGCLSVDDGAEWEPGDPCNPCAQAAFAKARTILRGGSTGTASGVGGEGGK
jgi:hypothetical protein